MFRITLDRLRRMAICTSATIEYHHHRRHRRLRRRRRCSFKILFAR